MKSIEENNKEVPSLCKNCKSALLEDNDGDLFCPEDCYLFYSKEKGRWYNY